MTQPNAQSNPPDARAQAARPPARPAGAQAGAGGGLWGPTTPTPISSPHIECIRTNAQRLIATLDDMRLALKIIKDRLDA